MAKFLGKEQFCLHEVCIKWYLVNLRQSQRFLAEQIGYVGAQYIQKHQDKAWDLSKSLAKQIIELQNKSLTPDHEETPKTV